MNDQYKIAYFRQQGSDSVFYNSNGGYIYNTLGECKGYTSNSFTVVSCGVTKVFKIDERGTVNLIMSEGKNFFGR